ncbi:metal-dependent hydrolase [Staphylococcus massiliensis]|uniref:metal-dependent hydrolase n=1 Tax=Staphylococcus massiliensis TaxID=555791 RepID=UPI001EDD21C2|nr:metal-dependent hydrolase [Staphylococcus massiliensis]MCG3412934.1 metal-dependent hydrolase [Staphylococcus massiliensis]
MDTATHIAIGVGLTAIATQDPSMHDNFPAIMTTLVAGSLIPDIDTVTKLKNNATYISNHRGVTHSIPFTILWPLILTLLIFTFFHDVHPMHVWLWAQLAVFLHVFVDIFNSYGTQALRPLSNKWIQLGIINTFDPIIFIILLIGIVLWSIGFHPYLVFFPILGILVAYYIIRYIIQQSIRKKALGLIDNSDKPVKVFVIPTLRFMQWRVAIQTIENDYVGRSYGGNIVFSDKVKRQPYPSESLMHDAKNDANIKAFLNFSSIYRWHTRRVDDETIELRFIDLRYLNDDHYAFTSIAHLNNDRKVLNSYTGWVFTEDKLQRKLHV